MARRARRRSVDPKGPETEAAEVKAAETQPTPEVKAEAVEVKTEEVVEPTAEDEARALKSKLEEADQKLDQEQEALDRVETAANREAAAVHATDPTGDDPLNVNEHLRNYEQALRKDRPEMTEWEIEEAVSKYAASFERHADGAEPSRRSVGETLLRTVSGVFVTAAFMFAVAREFCGNFLAAVTTGFRRFFGFFVSEERRLTVMIGSFGCLLIAAIAIMVSVKDNATADNGGTTMLKGSLAVAGGVTTDTAATAESEAIEARAEAATAKADARKARADVRKARAELTEAKAELSRAKAEASNARAEARNARAEARNARAEASNAKAEARNARAEVNRVKADATEAKAEIAKLKAAAPPVHLMPAVISRGGKYRVNPATFELFNDRCSIGYLARDNTRRGGIAVNAAGKRLYLPHRRLAPGCG